LAQQAIHAQFTWKCLSVGKHDTLFCLSPEICHVHSDNVPRCQDANPLAAFVLNIIVFVRVLLGANQPNLSSSEFKSFSDHITMKVTSRRNGLLFRKERAASGGVVLACNGTADGSNPWSALFFFSTFSRSCHNESVVVKKRITF
jgi:hypothetical protein